METSILSGRDSSLSTFLPAETAVAFNWSTLSFLLHANIHCHKASNHLLLHPVLGLVVYRTSEYRAMPGMLNSANPHAFALAAVPALWVQL
jgi:hypothetical protein